MPGFMGIRGLDLKNPHDTERRRREDRKVPKEELERRANEKAMEILRDQQGDMSRHTGDIQSDEKSDCYKIAGFMVGEIMSEKVVVLEFDDNLLTVEEVFAKARFRHLPVVEPGGEIIGILSDRDFLRTVSPFFGTVNEQTRDKEIMMRKVGTIMTRNPICANIDTTILQAVQLMNSNKISCLPIVELGGMRLLGIVTWKDVVRAFCPKAFDPLRDSARLKTGVRINPQTAESARLRARRAAEGEALSNEASKGLFENTEPDKGADVPKAVPAAAASSAPKETEDEHSRSEHAIMEVAPPHSDALERRRRKDGSETDFYAVEKPGIQIAASEKLPDHRTAGQAGSELALRQRALLREQLAGTTDSSRLRALRDEQHQKKD